MIQPEKLSSAYFHLKKKLEALSFFPATLEILPSMEIFSQKSKYVENSPRTIPPDHLHV
jgi:hypothetical protein